MTKNSIKARNFSSGQVKVFRSTREAAEGLGVTEPAVRYAMKNGGRCRGWMLEQVPTVYVIRMADDGSYYVAELAEGGGGFDVIGENGWYAQASEVSDAIDVTENFNRVRNGKYSGKA